MKKLKKTRFYFMYFVTAGIFGVIIWRLFSLQIINGEDARKAINKKLSLSVPIIAARGDICDRYGKPLVSSRTGYFIIIEKNTSSEQMRTEEILFAFSCLSEADAARYHDSLPISFTTPLAFTENPEHFLKEMTLPENASPDDVLSALCQKYHIPLNNHARFLCGVRYSMEQNGFSAASPYTLAEDVNAETVTRIKEHTDRIPSVSLQTRPVREYLYPGMASHLLGRVGKISKEELESPEHKGYLKTDVIGKQGIEKALEKELRGTDGIRSIDDFSDSAAIFTRSREPIPGNTVMLTLDTELQQTAESALRSAISEEKNGGAVVVTDVSNGEILVLASYPTYSPESFQEDFKSLTEHEGNPLFHRALAGLYTPGSTFKPISAIAALESNTVSPEEIMDTKGTYEYLDRTFQCNIFRTKGKTHGSIRLSEALGVSCNYFFYELGNRTGIDQIYQTASGFGLGEKSGTELEGEEATGKIASPENRQKNGGIWYPGDVLQTAIGQSDTLCTPLQLANYTAALANGGTLYVPHFVKSVKSAKDSRTISTNSPEIKRQIQVSEDTLFSIKKGMEMVTANGGTAGDVFSDFPVSVAGKTGSAQVPGGTNGLFIGYAPAEHPQIAVSVVIENGGSGTAAASVAKKVLQSYFEKPVQTGKQEFVPYTLLP